jgi:hypothetical protein
MLMSHDQKAEFLRILKWICSDYDAEYHDDEKKKDAATWIITHAEMFFEVLEKIKHTTNKQSVEMPCPSKLFPEWEIMESDWKRGAHAMYRALASHFTHLS